MILTSIQIISRVLGYPWPAFLELSELAISIFAFLGVAYAQRMDSHIRMELLVSNLKGRVKWLVEFISTFLSFVVISVLIYLKDKEYPLYLSSRVGKNNKTFLMPKFRTMKLNTPNVATHKLRNPEHYITKSGKFLRNLK